MCILHSAEAESRILENKISAAEAEGRIVKNFGFGRIFWPSVDHCVWLVFKSGLWSRVGYDGARTVVPTLN